MTREDGDMSWPLRRAARLHARSVAVVDGEREVTYGELERRVGCLGAALDDLGLPLGTRVGFLGANSLAHLVCWLGIPAFDRVFVDLNFRLAEAELAFMVEDCEVELITVDRERLAMGRALKARCPSLRMLVLDAAGDCPADVLAYKELLEREPMEPAGGDEHRLAAISYTGGTTGAPKGVMLSHGNLLANARHNLIATGHRASDNWLHVSPMFHVAGTSNMLACTWVGARQTILPRFEAATVAATIEREKISHALLVPTMLAMLLEHLDEHPAADLSSLRHVQYAASPITPDVQRRVLERFSCEVVQFYGMTEAAPTVSYCTGEDHRRGFAGEEPYVRRLASIGGPVVGVEAEVRRADGARLPPGEVGEIWVRGPNVMLGYWQRPEATEKAFVDDWYRSGDAAYADGDGYLYIVDRFKDMIVSGAENVYSIEVERALAEHDAVLEAAVFGIPHPRWGEAVHAVVTVAPDSGVTQEDLIAHCRERIAGYKTPQSIELRTEPLPKSGAGKLLKNVLREPFWEGHERRVN